MVTGTELTRLRQPEASVVTLLLTWLHPAGECESPDCLTCLGHFLFLSLTWLVSFLPFFLLSSRLVLVRISSF